MYTADLLSRSPLNRATTLDKSCRIVAGTDEVIAFQPIHYIPVYTEYSTKKYAALFLRLLQFHARGRGKESAEVLLAIKTKARIVVGRGGKALLSDPRCELRPGRERKGEKRCQDDRRDELKK